MSAVGDEQDEVAGVYVTATIAYVQRACGDTGVRRLLDAAGIDPTAVPTDTDWVTLPTMVALADAAASITGTPDVGRLVGEELFAMNVAAGIDEQIRSAGGPVPALEALAAVGSRMAGGWTLEVTEVGDHRLEIQSKTVHAVPHVFFCGLAVGYYARVPGVFGMRGTVIHPECLTRGDDRCHYVVRWAEVDERRGGPMFDVVAHFEKLQAVASELAAADGPAAVVRLAVELAARVTDGRRFMIRATVGPDGASALAHHGFDDDEAAEEAAQRIERGDLDGADDRPVVCVAPLSSGRASHGWLASFHPPHSTIDHLIERPLASYATHVASALEAALALDTARRDRDTAHTLVAFAHDLASVTTAEAVADLVEAALPAATGCADARVWLLDGSRAELRGVSSRSFGARRPALASADGSAGAAPHTITSGSELDRLHLGNGALAVSTVVPLVARGTILGCVAAGWSHPGDATSAAVERLEAMVDQAALALDVVGLLADLHDQALHDPLTGLANRSLLARRAEAAMDEARDSGRHIGLLFIDLDHFKLVNDEHGHGTGDEIIRAVADRLRELAQPGDTVARLGGDEFVVLLRDCGSEDEAVAVGEAVRAVMQAPFEHATHRLSLSATVGVFAAHPGDRTWHALLDRADAAMYLGKQRGRNAVTAITAPGTA